MGEVREPSFRDDETGVECAGNQVHEVTGGTASVKSAAPEVGRRTPRGATPVMPAEPQRFEINRDNLGITCRVHPARSTEVMQKLLMRGC